jgi:hypothetical protein
MNTKTFNNIFQDTIMELERLVSVKGGQYANTTNRLHNFDRAAEILRTSPLIACLGMWNKQLVSLLDALGSHETALTPDDHPAWEQDRCDEVINDLLVYLILTKALFYRAYGWEPKSIPTTTPPDNFCKCYDDGQHAQISPNCKIHAHMKTETKGSSHYVCDKCEYRTDVYDYFNLHEKSHQKERHEREKPSGLLYTNPSQSPFRKMP